MRRRRRWVVVHALAALAVTLALLRRRGYICARLSVLTDTLARALRTVRIATRLASRITDDAHAFFVPSQMLPSLPTPSSSQLTSCVASGVTGTAATTANVVPHSMQQLLRLAATPEGLSIVRAMAAGAVDAYRSSPSLPEQQSRSLSDDDKDTAALSQSAVSRSPISTDITSSCQTTAEYLVKLLSSPLGSQVLSVAVGAAVREALWAAPAGVNSKERDVGNKIVSGDVVSALTTTLTSDAGRRLVVDVAQTVTSTAMPHLVRAQLSIPATEPRTTMSAARGPSSRRFSASSVSSVTSSSTSATTCAPSSDAASRVVERLVLRSRTASFWERLAVIAIRDRALVHDVVRVVVTHAVRTYLVTQAELRGNTSITTPNTVNNAQVTSSTSNDADVIQSAARSDRSKRRASDTAEGPTSVWKVLARTVAVDLKRLLYSAGSQQASTGWTVF